MEWKLPDLPPPSRRRWAFGLLGAAVGVLLLAAVATLLEVEPIPLYLGAAGVILLVLLGGELFLLFAKEPGAFELEGEWYEWEEESSTSEGELVLRCGGCGKTFSVRDTGTRPLAGRCPHCGSEGSLGAGV